MRLSDYLSSQETKPSEFAALLGVPSSTIIRWMRGDRTPRPEMMRAIIDATNGAVTPNDFLPPAPDDSRPSIPPQEPMEAAQ